MRLPMIGNLLVLMALTMAMDVVAQSTGDYQSTGAGTGNWNTLATWERFDGVSFVPAPSVPTASDGVITILAGHTVTANTAITADQVVVAAGGTLLASGSTFALANGAGTDLAVNGTLQLAGATVSGPGTAEVATGGSFTWTAGFIANSATLNLATGSTGTFNPGATNLALGGTLNNSGTWTMQSGNLVPSGSPSLFNNLSGGVVDLNGWLTPTSSWTVNLTNQGTVNKNNGAVQFTLNPTTATNSGPSPSNSGEFHLHTSTFTHSGSIAALPGGSVRMSSGTFNHNAGGTIAAPFTASGGSLNVNTPLSLASFTLAGGQLNGPQAVSIPTGGVLSWTAGFIANTATLNLVAGSTGTFNPSATSLSLAGTLNNSGTFTMQSGNLIQSSTPSLFNNLPGAVLALNGWQSTTSSWSA
ncbi:MAG: hypothetical protein ACK6A5_17255, partial [Flavobacteriales bacterium]